MRKLVLILVVAMMLGVPSLFACSMDFIPWIPPEPPLPPDPPAEPPPEPPPPPPTFADAPPVSFEIQNGREEPVPPPSVVRWCDESLVLG